MRRNGNASGRSVETRKIQQGNDLPARMQVHTHSRETKPLRASNAAFRKFRSLSHSAFTPAVRSTVLHFNLRPFSQSLFILLLLFTPSHINGLSQTTNHTVRSISLVDYSRSTIRRQLRQFATSDSTASTVVSQQSLPRELPAVLREIVIVP